MHPNRCSTIGFTPRSHTHTPTHSLLRNDAINMASIRSDTIPSPLATHPGDDTVLLCHRLVTESATHLGHGRRRPARSAAPSVTRWGTLQALSGRRYSLRRSGGMRRSRMNALFAPLEGSRPPQRETHAAGLSIKPNPQGNYRLGKRAAASVSDVGCHAWEMITTP